MASYYDEVALQKPQASAKLAAALFEIWV